MMRRKERGYCNSLTHFLRESNSEDLYFIVGSNVFEVKK